MVCWSMVDVFWGRMAGRLLFEVEAASDAFHLCDWLSVILVLVIGLVALYEYQE